jgi:hypothetical protein
MYDNISSIGETVGMPPVSDAMAVKRWVDLEISSRTTLVVAQQREADPLRSPTTMSACRSDNPETSLMRKWCPAKARLNSPHCLPLLVGV